MLQKLWQFLFPPVAEPGIAKLYQNIVAQARRPVFYQAYGVPDSVDGRFDLLLLHAILAMRRMTPEARQALFDLMFADMDQSLREMGVGDMSIGKKIKPMIAAFYGRAKAYEAALGEPDQALIEVLRRNLYRKADVTAGQVTALAHYVRQASSALDLHPASAIMAGDIYFVDPQPVTSGGQP
jgi:cytochrome b pre-mRNA-processing protein 3